MIWFNLLKGVLSIAHTLLKYMSNKQLIEAGQYRAIAKDYENAFKKIEAAQIARSNASNTSVHDDPNNRDNN